jgi:AraC-like DNA-binding protein
MQAQRLDAFSIWLETIRAFCGRRFTAKPSLTGSLFIGDISQRRLAGLELAMVKTNAASLTRQHSHDEDDGDRYCFLVMQCSGRAQITQHGLTIELAPGEMALVDSAGNCEINPLGLMEHCSIHLPREAVVRHFSDQQHIFGKLNSGSASGRLLRLICTQLAEGMSVQEWQDDEGEALQESLISLLKPALTMGEQKSAAELQIRGGTLRSGVEQLIHDQLTDASLSPAKLAAQLGISIRQLYRLFEEEGDSVCRYIQRARLVRSAADLVDHRLANESITDIAFKWGFTDSAHFSRTFKKQFELSPRDYRSQSMTA